MSAVAPNPVAAYAATPSAATPSAMAQAIEEHIDWSLEAIGHLRRCAGHVIEWGSDLTRHLNAGQRLLVAGNGGSAAHAAHLVAELVGRYRIERRPYSAILLGADIATNTALVNDYEPEALFERQVLAHGQPGDRLLAISTSGSSANLLRAARAAQGIGLDVWTLTGRAPNPLATIADRSIAIVSERTATVQEAHQVVVHLLCEVVDSTANEHRTPCQEASLCREASPCREASLWLG